MITTSELNALDHSIYSAINRIRGHNKRADRNSVHKEILKQLILKKISKNFLHDRINMLIQNDKIVNMLHRNKDSFRTTDNDFNSSITHALPMTQKSPSYLSNASFSASRDQSYSNQIIQIESNGVKLRELKEDIINELRGKMTGII